MSRPRIVVAGQWWADRGSLRPPVHYIRAVQAAGGEAVVVSPFRLQPGEEVPGELGPVDMVTGLDPGDASVMADASGLVVPGGGDVDPAWYGQEPHPRTNNISHRRDGFERTLVLAALERDLPVLAICHGMQLLNVVLGGTLDQHLADRAERLEHDRDQPRTEPVHSVRLEVGTRLRELLGGDEVQVNSHHHQGVDVTAPMLREAAWAGDGVLEAVESPGHRWVIGVQWHPEVMAPVDEAQRRLFDGFVEAARDGEARTDQGAPVIGTPATEATSSARPE